MISELTISLMRKALKDGKFTWMISSIQKYQIKNLIKLSKTILLIFAYLQIKTLF
jgi:hypothetical protein